MNGYVAKPVVAEQLFAELARCLPDAVVAVVAAPVVSQTSGGAASSGAPLLDRQETLARLGGDGELLATLSAMFRAELPRHREKLAASLAVDADAAAWIKCLADEAHTLKSLFATFSAPGPTAQALALERAARQALAAGGPGGDVVLAPLRSQARELDATLVAVAAELDAWLASPPDATVA